jgi:3-oxoacyl-[acyl-carrier-protein] synthase II
VERVVVTGLGAVSPCGLDVAETWSSICAGQSGAGPITTFSTEGWKVRIAAEVKGFDPTGIFGRRDARRMDRFTQFGVAAAEQAIRDAGLETSVPLGERVAVYVGSGIGGIHEIEKGSIDVHLRGPKAVSPFFVIKCLANLTAGHISIRYGILGPCLSVSTACAVGNHSIGEAWRLLAMRGADVVIAGGCEAPITPVSIAGFSVMRALSKRNDDPRRASRPFDTARDGFLMGEGAGILVMETLTHARARGAKIYAEVVGYASTSDAHHITAPSPGHAGAVRCMRAALATAGIAPQDVDYINAHGTSTPQNDINEALAIREVFGDAAAAIHVSSTKASTGHLLGAAGGLEAVLTVKALQEGIVPPTATLETVDPDIDVLGLQLPSEALSAPLGVAISNAFGFGGTNATLVFRRWEE